MSKAMRRVIRSARALHDGPRILELIQQPRTRERLIAAAASGAPPVTAISGRLMEVVGARNAKLSPVKQFTGLCIRAVLEEEGFQVAAKGVRVSNDPVFQTGSTYERAPIEKTTKPTFWERFAESLTPDEAKELLRVLRGREK